MSANTPIPHDFADRAYLGAYYPRAFTIELADSGFSVAPDGKMTMPLSLFPKLDETWLELLTDVLPAAENEYRKIGNDGVADLYASLRVGSRKLYDLQFNASRRFPLDTFLCTNSTGLSVEEKVRRLDEMTKEVPIPLILSPDGTMVMLHASQAEQDLAFVSRSFVALFRFIWTGTTATTECPFLRSCNLPLKDTECENRPWMKGRVARTCCYGVAAKAMGIQPTQELALTPF